MFHGGTNFGFYNGANDFGSYEPTVTSYDYNALLNESGDITDKYLAIRDVISRYVEIPKVEIPELQPKQNYGSVQLTEHAPLFESLQQLSSPVQRTCPETMESLGQNYGFILYTTRITGPRAASKLALQNVRDRALVYLDGRYQGVINRNTHDITLAIKENDILLEIPLEGATLSILVENMGRTNYGWMMKDPKGITEGVRLERQFLYDWTIHTLPMDELTGLEFSSKQQISGASTPTFYRGTFTAQEREMRSLSWRAGRRA